MNKKIFIIAGSVILGLAALFLIYQAVVKVGSKDIRMDETAASLEKAQKMILKSGDEDSAIRELEALISKSQDSAKAEAGYIALASIHETRHDFLKAKELYQKAIEKFPDSGSIVSAQEALDNVNIKILFSPIITADSAVYEIQKGDTLVKIAKKFNTTVDLLKRANGLKSDTINIGKKLKVINAKFSVVVDKSQNILTLKSDENILKTYKVSTGQNFSTPTGAFKITTKLMDPVWYTTGAVIPAGSPNNILGSRWLGISKAGYGIHGTTDPISIGRQVTAGCVRMTNPDVEELYTIVPEETTVVIVD